MTRGLHDYTLDRSYQSMHNCFANFSLQRSAVIGNSWVDDTRCSTFNKMMIDQHLALVPLQSFLIRTDSMALAAPLHPHSPTRFMIATITLVPIPIVKVWSMADRATLTLAHTAKRPPDASDGDGSFLLAVVIYNVPKFCTTAHNTEAMSGVETLARVATASSNRITPSPHLSRLHTCPPNVHEVGFATGSCITMST